MYIAIELPGILIDLIVRFLSIPLVFFGAEMYIAIELPGILIDLIVRFLSIPLTFFGDVNSYRITSFENKTKVRKSFFLVNILPIINKKTLYFLIKVFRLYAIVAMKEH
jgi:hypothetical protein